MKLISLFFIYNPTYFPRILPANKVIVTQLEEISS